LAKADNAADEARSPRGFPHEMRNASPFYRALPPTSAYPVFSANSPGSI
jgi:hypothetical protein